MDHPSRRTMLVGLVGLLIASGLAVRLLVEHDGDPTIFAAFGEDSEITVLAEEQLGRQVVTREGIGHDGRFFFVLANDPWLTNPEAAALMDRPAYRAQRILYPMVAGGAGFLQTGAVVWGLLIVNLVAMGVGTWGVSTLASDMGGSPWWGLAFVLNVGLISEMNVDAAGVLAAAAAFWALVMLRRAQRFAGLALLTAAALSREVMLIAAAGSALWLWRRDERRTAVLAVAIPTAFVAVWGLFVRARLGSVGPGAEIEEIGWPLVGLVQAFEGWVSDPIDLAAGTAIFILLALFARRVFVSEEIVGWAFLGFVPVALLLTEQVWLSYFDISRAVAPVLTAFVLLLFTDASQARRRLPTSVAASQ